MWRQIDTSHRVNSDAEMEVLESFARTARERTGSLLAIEIGGYCGASALLFSKHFEKVITIDPWGHEEYLIGFDKDRGLNQYFPVYMQNIEKAQLLDRVYPIVSTSIVLNALPRLGAGIIYIDGAHFYEPVRDDILRAIPHLHENGLLVFDDYMRPGFGYPPFYDKDEDKPNPHMSRVDPYFGVKQAVDEFLGRGEFEVFEHFEGLVATQRKK